MGVGHSPQLKYTLTLANPKEFYHEIHRPGHFLQFAKDHVPEDLDNVMPEAQDVFQ